MQRDWDLKEVSDGKLYTENDLVKVGCNDCQGCSSCCHGMGTSIVLDPRDVFCLTVNLNRSFQQLLEREVELNVVEGIILPNLKMDTSQNGQEACLFLNEQGRCSIHPFRPGICRLFPLGRIYDEQDFKYFLQVHECKKTGRTKMKVGKWLDIPELKTYHRYIAEWHFFLKKLQKLVGGLKEDAQIKKVNMLILTIFFVQPYEGEREFYEQFAQRMETAKSAIQSLE